MRNPLSGRAGHFEHPAGLGEVDPVVPGGEPERHVVALGSALAVATDTLAIQHRAPRPQIEVGPADGLEGREQQCRVVLVVFELGNPQGLVVADDVGFVLGQDPANARANDVLRIEQVAEAFKYRPLAGFRAR